MITITLNGEAHTLPAPTTALDLVASTTGRELGPAGTPADGGRLGVALALDGEVVRRGLWSETTVGEGRRVDIVTAVQGG